MSRQFEWDDQKAAGNRTKHGVSFEEAITVFDNPLAIIFDDNYYSDDEQRELMTGHSTHGRLLMVVFIEQIEGIVRIISARCATRQERRDYEENLYI